MRRLLWVGDAACPSGFARSTHHTLEVLRQSWEIFVIGINYRGDPHSYPYPIYPASKNKYDDFMGVERLRELVPKIRPDVVVVQNDPWNLPAYMRAAPTTPMIASLAVDGKNVQGRVLNGLACAIFWTQFGAEETIRGGYKGPYAVIPLGVDLNVYKPMSTDDSRRKFFSQTNYETLKDKFIVGNVNRNQPRKRMDLTISYFAEWVKSRRIDDAYLSLHVAPTGDAGYDCQQLMTYYGLSNRLILSAPEVWEGITESEMVTSYNTYDIGFTSTQGEGWGLTTMELMACGKPVIAPDWSALGEWPEDAILKVPCSDIACTVNNINIVGGVMDRAKAIDALDLLYNSRDAREEYSRKGLELVRRPHFRWDAIGAVFNEAVEAAIDVLGVRVL